MKKIIFTMGLLVNFLFVFSPGLYSQNLDFGDAPEPFYPTLLVNNGPRHLMMPLLFLGSFRDAEPDGIPGNLSNGDDMTGGPDDEDGIRFITWLIPGQNCTIEVIASSPGILNGWIDFQVNMQWTDPGDWIFQDLPVSKGSNILTFTVPNTVIPGMLTYARFRLSTTSGLSYSGLAPDGEVEDYRVILGAPLSPETFMDPDPSLSFTQNEISLVRISGTSSSYNGWLIAAYNDSPFPAGPGMGVSVSNDNGSTWFQLQLPYPVNGFSGIPMAESFDPSIAADDSGNIFIAQIATDANWFSGPVNGLYVYKSTNGGSTWNVPVTVDLKGPPSGVGDTSYRLNDRCQVRIDKFKSSPHYNAVYLTWIQDRGWYTGQPYGDIYFSRSGDGGATYSPALRVNSWNHNMGNMPVHDIAPDGTIYLLWVDYNVQTGGQGTFFLDKSMDGGATWGSDTQIITVNLPPLNLNQGTDARAKGAAVLRVNPANSQELYVVYAADADTTDSDEADIYLIASHDAGSTWTVPVRVNDDLSTSDQMLPWMEVQNDGTIHIAWYDRRNDPGDLIWDVYYTNSYDGGQTFDINHKINLASFLTPQTQVGAWMGEYLGLAVADYSVYVAFTSSVQDPQGDVLFGSYLFSSAGQDETKDSADESCLFSLYPNPCKDELNISLRSGTGVTWLYVEMFSGTGICISQAEIHYCKHFSIPVSNLFPGIYWLKITTNFSTGIQKFVKQY